ncbi:MAG: hypothetical protein HN478_01875 [Rhodospirillaceae bacterium]|nr:hypothetical protein [Rhodospirillaceae bacterium]MBT4488514.1 hypothetical protein [Rhodospirillaceae bacterium]MBT4689015.1 hypothetical protein [Rhodospirillaceae bacterium]MBT5899079.1 hypothetical protein [Rhodospirillaceae bacterium]MBT7759661.1 hypothetical protein [Rhodospirillaceae bacterium]
MAKVSKEPLRILMVGFTDSLPGARHAEFYTDEHFLDYDVVIIDPAGALNGSGDDYRPFIRDDKLELSPHNGSRFRRRYFDVVEKMLQFVTSGMLAIVISRFMPTLVAESDYHQEGFEADLNNWGAKKIRKGRGSSIEFPTTEPLGKFWTATRPIWSYESVFDKDSNTSHFAHVKGHSNEIVAKFNYTKGGGHLLLAPAANLDVLYSDEQKADNGDSKFVQAVAALHETVYADRPTPALPDWTGDYSLPGENELKSKIAGAGEQIRALQKDVGHSTKELDRLSLHKLLITGYDTPLELAVDRVLEELGLKIEVGPKGRVDRTAVYGDRKFAVEVQGVRRGAKEDHVRSLIIWVQEVALEDEGKEPKGLLVVNPYRDTPLAERGNNPWTEKIIEICERQGYCVMTGLQLLGLYFDAKTNDARRQELIQQMFDTEGVFAGFENWQDFLTAPESEAADEE